MRASVGLDISKFPAMDPAILVGTKSAGKTVCEGEWGEEGKWDRGASE